MYCLNCGQQNPEGAQTCFTCGAPLPVSGQPQVPYQNNAYQQPYYQPYMQQPYETPGKGLGVASLVLGILSLVSFCIFYFSIPFAIVGLVLGCISNSKAKAAGMKNGIAVSGIACSAVGIGLAVIFFALLVAGVMGAEAVLNDYYGF